MHLLVSIDKDRRQERSNQLRSHCEFFCELERGVTAEEHPPDLQLQAQASRQWLRRMPRHRAKMSARLSKIRCKIGRRSSKIIAKSTKNRRKIDPGPFWAPKAVPGTHPDALGTRPDTLGTALRRPQAAPRPILGRPGRAGSEQETVKSDPGPSRGRSQTAPEHRPSVFGASNTIERARGTIFRRFCVVARKHRCAFRISFNGVSWTSDEVSTARARRAKMFENRAISASKTTPRATETRPGAARSRGKSRPERAKSARSTSGVTAIFFCGCERGLQCEKSACWAGLERGDPREPRTSSRNLRMDVGV